MIVSKRKRYNREQRLQSAKNWIREYKGQRIVKDYRKFFGVDFPTAFKELELLGVKISDEYKETVLNSVEGGVAKRRQKKNVRQVDIHNINQDENFAYIVGYTSGGAPYGLTWDEWEKCCGDDDEM